MLVSELLLNFAFFLGGALLAVVVLRTHSTAHAKREKFLDTQQRRWGLERKRLELIFLRAFEPSEFPTHQLLVATDGISPTDSAFRLAVNGVMKRYEELADSCIRG
jgi:hypothetical protein